MDEDILAYEALMQAVGDAPRREGWGVFECWGSENGDYQIQRIDSPDDETHDELPDDTSAWLIVMRGTGEHHRLAREFIEKYSPMEWAAINKFMENQP